MPTTIENPERLEPGTRAGEELRRHIVGLRKHKMALREIITHFSGVYAALEKIDNQ